jgi:hypothetical protein
MQAQLTIIEDHENAAMTSFVNDHSKAEKDFDSLFNFFHEYYFFRMTFEFIYLNVKKTATFTKKLNMIKFIKEFDELRSFIKHKTKVLE